MRKKFLSYITMVIVMFVVGVNVVKAEDYNFSTKVYKVDVVDDNFITRFNNGEFQEVKSGGTLNAGDTIAVGVYIDVKNPTGSIFDIRLNWDDSLLDVIIDNDNFMYYFYDDRSQFNGGLFPNTNSLSKRHDWYFDCYLYLNETTKEGPKIKSKFYDKNDKTTFDKSGILYWVPFTIKNDINSEVNLNFDFSLLDIYNNNGRTRVDSVSSSSSTFKINGNKSIAYSSGDANGNGKIDFGDVMLSMAFYMANLSMNAEEKDAADLNNDGRVTLSDTLLIIEKLFENN